MQLCLTNDEQNEMVHEAYVAKHEAHTAKYEAGKGLLWYGPVGCGMRGSAVVWAGFVWYERVCCGMGRFAVV